MNRRGFVLLSVLWVVVLLSGVGFGVMEMARVETTAHRNRVVGTRAAWARRACQQILEARFAARPGTLDVDPVDLGRRTWCRARLVPAAGRPDVPLEACDGPCGTTTFVAEIEAGVGPSPIRAYGRVVYRDAGRRLAVLFQEME